MSTTSTTSTVDTGEDISALATLRRGMAISPELKDGLLGTFLLAVLATIGQVVIPIVVQQTLDRGLDGQEGPDVRFMVEMGLVAALAIVVTGVASFFMTSRLFRARDRVARRLEW